jgi:hypothetical protein
MERMAHIHLGSRGHPHPAALAREQTMRLSLRQEHSGKGVSPLSERVLANASPIISVSRAYGNWLATIDLSICGYAELLCSCVYRPNFLNA